MSLAFYSPPEQLLKYEHQNIRNHNTKDNFASNLNKIITIYEEKHQQKCVYFTTIFQRQDQISTRNESTSCETLKFVNQMLDMIQKMQNYPQNKNREQFFNLQFRCKIKLKKFNNIVRCLRCKYYQSTSVMYIGFVENFIRFIHIYFIKKHQKVKRLMYKSYKNYLLNIAFVCFYCDQFDFYK